MEPFSDMDKFFDGFRHGAMTSYSPAMDIYEQDDHLIVEAGLAGIDPKNVEVIFVQNGIEKNLQTTVVRSFPPPLKGWKLQTGAG